MNKVSEMQRRNVTICEWCGVEKQGLGFFIGATLQPDWCLVEGTGKMACPQCYPKARAEAQELFAKMMEGQNE